jgi:hypothetical protein
MARKNFTEEFRRQAVDLYLPDRSRPMKFLAISTNRNDPTPHLPAEGARTAELVEAGVRVLLKADRSGAVLVLEVSDAAAARAAVDSLPLVQHGVTRFDLTELMEVPTHAA